MILNHSFPCFHLSSFSFLELMLGIIRLFILFVCNLVLFGWTNYFYLYRKNSMIHDYNGSLKTREFLSSLMEARRLFFAGSLIRSSSSTKPEEVRLLDLINSSSVFLIALVFRRKASFIQNNRICLK